MFNSENMEINYLNEDGGNEEQDRGESEKELTSDNEEDDEKEESEGEEYSEEGDGGEVEECDSGGELGDSGGIYIVMYLYHCSHTNQRHL